MQHHKWILALAVLCWFAAPPFIQAQPQAASNPPIIAVTTERPLAELLPDKLAGVKATGDLKQFTADNLAELVGDQAIFFREYYVTRAASRQYGAIRVDIFESSHPFGAFGLVMFLGRPGVPHSKDLATHGSIKSNYYIQLATAVDELRGMYSPAAKPSDTPSRLYRGIIEKIPERKPDERPVLFRSLPEMSSKVPNPYYVLGPEALNVAVPGTRDLYAFNGDAEAVVAEYQINKPAESNSPPAKHVIKLTGAAPPVEPMKLVIVEYHTPQFAYDAINRANEYVHSLPEAEQQRVIIKREGNFIVEAVNFNDRAAAQSIVDAVQYPYGVQWLHHPSIPSPDPFRAQKAAQMLLSTFGLLGILLGSVLVAGSIVGTTMFLKRRKQMQAAFSDAGHMLRLELDPFEEHILGLPPKRE